MEKETLRKMVFAPVNLFFDITPLGKIYTIFINEMIVVYEMGFAKFADIVDRLSWMVVLLFIIFAIQGGVFMFLVFILVLFLMYRIQIPNSYNASQIIPIMKFIGDKEGSFLSETIRGTTTICAFNQESKVLS